MNKMMGSVPQTANNVVYSKRKKPTTSLADTVKVHVMKLEDLPDPLTKREFREVCQRQGIKTAREDSAIILADETRIPAHQTSQHQNEAFAAQHDMQKRRKKQRVDNVVSNLYGAYLAIYDQFKTWHGGIIQERHVGPVAMGEHYSAMKEKNQQWQQTAPGSIGSRPAALTDKEQLHVKGQLNLVSLLIEYGIGSGLETGPKSPGRSRKIRYLQSGTENSLTAQRRSKTISGDHRLVFGEVNATDSARFDRGQHMGKSMQQVGFNLNTLSNFKGNYLQSSSDGSRNSRQNQGGSMEQNSMDIIETQEDQCLTGEEMSSYRYYEEGQSPQTHQRLKVITSKRYIAKDIALSKQTPASHFITQLPRNRDGTAKQLNENELNDEKEFYSEVQQRLRLEFIEARKNIVALNERLKLAEKRNVKIISNYTKEEMARTVHAKIMKMPYPEQAELIKNQIEARFYNVADGLDPEVEKVINVKMVQIKEYFINQVQLVSHHSDSFRQNVALMESLNKEGIKFADLDTERLIEIIADVESLKRDQNAQLCQLDPSIRGQIFYNRPFAIWHMFHKHFGTDYFLQVIEEEYGIAPGSNEFLTLKINAHFDHYLQNYRDVQEKLEKHYEEQVATLKNELEELTESNARLIRHDQIFQDKALRELRKNQKVLVQSKGEAIVKQWKVKYENASAKVTQMAEQRVNEYRSLKSSQMNYCWKKWQMFTTLATTIKKVAESRRTGIDIKMLRLCEKFIVEEELILRYSSEHKIDRSLVKAEIWAEKQLEFKHRIEEVSDSYGHASNNASAYSMSIEQYRAELEKLAAENRNLRLQVPQMKAQVERYEEVLRLKEREAMILNDEIKNIEMRWKNGTKEPHKYTAKPLLEALKLKSLNEFSAHMIRQAAATKRTAKTVTHKGTITEIADLKVKVDYEKQPVRLMMMDQGVDATPLQLEESAQTERLGMIDVAIGRDRDFTLHSRKVGPPHIADGDKKTGMKRQGTLNSNDMQNAMRKVGGAMRASFRKSQNFMKSQVLPPSDFRFPGNSSITGFKMLKDQSQVSRSKIQEVLQEERSTIANKKHHQVVRRPTTLSAESARNDKLAAERSISLSAAQQQTDLSLPMKNQKCESNGSLASISSNSQLMQHPSDEKLTDPSILTINLNLTKTKSWFTTNLASERPGGGSKVGGKIVHKKPRKHQFGNKDKQSLKSKKPLYPENDEHRLVSATQASHKSFNKMGSKPDLLSKQQKLDRSQKPESSHKGQRDGKKQSMAIKSNMARGPNDECAKTLKSNVTRSLANEPGVGSNGGPQASQESYEYNQKDAASIQVESFEQGSIGGHAQLNAHRLWSPYQTVTEHAGVKSSDPRHEKLSKAAFNERIEIGRQFNNHKASTLPIADQERLKNQQAHYVANEEELAIDDFQSSHHNNEMIGYRTASPSSNPRQVLAETDHCQSMVSQSNHLLRFSAKKVTARTIESGLDQGSLTESSNDNDLEERTSVKKHGSANSRRVRPMTVAHNQLQSHSMFSQKASSDRLMDKMSHLGGPFKLQTEQRYDEKKRLTCVKETETDADGQVLVKDDSFASGDDEELDMQHQIDRKTSQFSKTQRCSAETLSPKGVKQIQSRLLLDKTSSNEYGQVNQSKQPGGSKFSPISRHLAIEMVDSSNSSGDSSQYNERHGKVPKRKSSPISQICSIVDDVKATNHPGRQNQTKIQRLLIDGHINEEQFICLQLLEKGFVPSCPAESSSARYQEAVQRPLQSSQTAMNLPADWVPIQASSAHQTPGRSFSPQKKFKRIKHANQMMYKVYPQKLQVLQKLLDRCYSQRCSVGVQCGSGIGDETATNFNTDLNNGGSYPKSQQQLGLPSVRIYKVNAHRTLKTTRQGLGLMRNKQATKLSASSSHQFNRLSMHQSQQLLKTNDGFQQERESGVHKWINSLVLENTSLRKNQATKKTQRFHKINKINSKSIAQQMTGNINHTGNNNVRTAQSSSMKNHQVIEYAPQDDHNNILQLTAGRPVTLPISSMMLTQSGSLGSIETYHPVHNLIMPLGTTTKNSEVPKS